ncbi:MAG: DEAD/DEAH box helicase [Actinomycetaceae bacterium]|nr:DEAD/DEAH box helicase [Actinomycetaceae bacterium]MDY6083154.1 DEAD/DEAH box helicase [Actinomycetaceae bacterium]
MQEHSHTSEEFSDVNATDTHFGDLGLAEPLVQAIADLGFETTTAIQAQAIPPLLSGRDVIGVAQTGTGKTAAFGLPLLTMIDPSDTSVQALVLVPTRELAQQGAAALESFAAHMPDVTVLPVYGGSPYGPQLRALEEGAQVVVGTPGRIMDLMNRGALSLQTVHFFVLDEADEMLQMGFAEDVDVIASAVPAGRISALFSATMPPSIRRVADEHLHDPVQITISRPASTVSTVHQTFATVSERYKAAALVRVLRLTTARAVLIFVRTRATAEDLALDLGRRGIQAATLSGDVAQKDRERLVTRLREGTLNVIVATDVAARGLDVDRIDLVINYDVPREADTYVHRIGRTGRAKREGESLTFVTPKERSRLRRIEKHTGSQIDEMTLPTATAVRKARAAQALRNAHLVAAQDDLSDSETALDAYYDAPTNSDTPANSDASAPSYTLAFTDVFSSAGSLAGAEPARLGEARSVDNALGDEANAAFDEDDRGEAANKPDDRPVSLHTLAAAMLSMLLGSDSDLDADEPDDLTIVKTRDRTDTGREGSRGKGGARGHASASGSVTYRVEVGRKDNVRPAAIVGAIAGESGIRGSDIGHIEIFPTFSLVDIAVSLSHTQMNAISHATIGGRELRISEDHGPQSAGRSKRGMYSPSRHSRSDFTSDSRARGGDRHSHRPHMRNFDREGKKRNGFDTRHRNDFSSVDKQRGGERHRKGFRTY